jgi:hypothetical protein
MEYTSIQSNFRGFNYQKDYGSKERFNEDMKKEHEGRDEICWAHLFTKGGEMVATYRRGYTMAEYL